MSGPHAGQRRAPPAMARRAARQPRSCGSATSAIAARRKRRVRIAPRCSGDFLTPSPPGEKTTACGVPCLDGLGARGAEVLDLRSLLGNAGLELINLLNVSCHCVVCEVPFSVAP